MIEHHPQETLLIHYADGLTSPDENQRVQELVASDPVALEFLQQLRQTGAWLEQASTVPPEEAPTSVSKLVGGYRSASTEQKQPGNRLALVATLLAGVVGGAFLGANLDDLASDGPLVVVDASPPEWVRLVADYHRLYARETIGDTPSQDESETSAQLAKKLNRKFAVPALDNFGLEFKRVQTLVFDKQPLLQLAYLPDTNRPIAICILAAGDAALDQVQSGTHDRMKYAYWQDKQHAVVIVGEISQTQMDELISQVRRSLFPVG